MNSSAPRSAPSRPRAYGVDFYGDNLCTSEAEVKAHPDRVAAFRAASLKGWAYALAHKEATVDLILKTYSAKKSREALLFEAAHTDLLVRRGPGHIGQQDAEHWRKIATTYRKLGLLADDTLPAGLMWNREDEIEGRWLIPLLLVPVGLAIAALLGTEAAAPCGGHWPGWERLRRPPGWGGQG